MSVRRLRSECRELWEDLSDSKQLSFVWPPNTPLEVHELVGAERFDPSNPKYYIPLFWKLSRVPATPSWGLLVCFIECLFGLFCFIMNVLHFMLYLPAHSPKALPLFVFSVTMLEISIFFAFKVLFVISLVERRSRLLRVQLVFQYTTCVLLLLNAAFALSADWGGFDEKTLYADHDPILIRIVAISSFIFFFIQLLLRVITLQVFHFMHDSRVFKTALYNSWWRYRKRVYFSYCSIMQEDLKLERERKMIEDEMNRVRRETETRFSQFQHRNNVTNINVAIDDHPNPFVSHPVDMDDYMPLLPLSTKNRKRGRRVIIREKRVNRSDQKKRRKEDEVDYLLPSPAQSPEPVGDLSVTIPETPPVAASPHVTASPPAISPKVSSSRRHSVAVSPDVYRKMAIHSPPLPFRRDSLVSSLGGFAVFKSNGGVPMTLTVEEDTVRIHPMTHHQDL